MPNNAQQPPAKRAPYGYPPPAGRGGPTSLPGQRPSPKMPPAAFRPVAPASQPPVPHKTRPALRLGSLPVKAPPQGIVAPGPDAASPAAPAAPAAPPAPAAPAVPEPQEEPLPPGHLK